MNKKKYSKRVKNKKRSNKKKSSIKKRKYSNKLKCWPGYVRVKGKKPGTKGSCKKR